MKDFSYAHEKDHNLLRIGIILAKTRKEKKLTQKELATRSGISLSSLKRYETGERYPNIEQLQSISQALEVSIDDLLGTYQKPKGERIPTDNPDDRYPYLLNKELHGELAPEEAEELKQLKRLNKIAGHLDKLTECGQEEAVKRVAELTEIPKYRKPFKGKSKPRAPSATSGDDEKPKEE